jgi:hypothetical protein
VRSVSWVRTGGAASTNGYIQVDIVNTAASNGIAELTGATNVLTFEANVTPSGVVTWACGSPAANTTVLPKYRPGSCK